MRKITIAIDGHSSCGKSTMAKDLARAIGYIYVQFTEIKIFIANNRILFDADDNIDEPRLAELLPSAHIGFELNEETGRPDTYLNGECVEKEIRGMEVSSRVSKISAIGFVRECLVKQQQQMGAEKGVVMDGRDIGTVVFPDAELKIFVTASAEVRAERRYKELLGKGEEADYDEILRNVQERDYLDSHREVSPLRKADDAIELDNSHMTIPEQNEWMLAQYERVVAEFN